MAADIHRSLKALAVTPNYRRNDMMSPVMLASLQIDPVTLLIIRFRQTNVGPARPSGPVIAAGSCQLVHGLSQVFTLSCFYAFDGVEAAGETGQRRLYIAKALGCVQLLLCQVVGRMAYLGAGCGPAVKRPTIRLGPPFRFAQLTDGCMLCPGAFLGAALSCWRRRLPVASSTL